MPEALTGRCACGEVRYRLASEPIFTHCCHCLDCQRQTGSGFAVNAIIETDRVEILSGTPEAIRVPTDSGYPHDIYRCPTCKTAVWSDYAMGYVLFVRVGTLDDPSRITPDVHIYTRSKLPWGRTAGRGAGIRGLLRPQDPLAGECAGAWQGRRGKGEIRVLNTAPDGGYRHGPPASDGWRQVSP